MSVGNPKILIVEDEPLQMDMIRHIVSIADARITLGPIEFKLLKVLIEAPGRVFRGINCLGILWIKALCNGYIFSAVKRK